MNEGPIFGPNGLSFTCHAEVYHANYLDLLLSPADDFYFAIVAVPFSFISLGPTK